LVERLTSTVAGNWAVCRGIARKLHGADVPDDSAIGSVESLLLMTVDGASIESEAGIA
jgi:hypothetical protein